ncbi:S-layer homology domain-containing protein [Brevibacillus brevis]|uniref:S-layer homology domain-containing protein n=1 Tax=Brevibacillus brevis TaxID=1393 RepID=A0ABY9T397_BREBE|nr:S-layer homology domain-containing protein [Brevibacillus brevis]WNC14587.1 S-layer homology domain-containing protein [Brevibacillus brevis]
MNMVWKCLGISILLSGLLWGQAAVDWGAGRAEAAQPQPNPTVSDFAKHPAKDAILLGLQKGYLWKYPDGRFDPDRQIVQSQFVASLVAIRGVKETAPVPELPAGHWAKATYERARKAGILSEVKIDPNKPLTKEEAAQLVFNAWKPYRGVKMKGYSNTGALITWGWMDPAPAGQPKFREDLPVTRGDAAKILAYLWKDKWQLELGAKWAEEFERSLVINNGVLKGNVPKGNNEFSIMANVIPVNNGMRGFLNGELINIKVIDYKPFIILSIRNTYDSSNVGLYYYSVPSLKKENKTIQFSSPNSGGNNE